MKLVAWICAPFAWKVVRQHEGYNYFENAVTGQRRCCWDGSPRCYPDYKFLRLGDICYGSLGREVL